MATKKRQPNQPTEPTEDNKNGPVGPWTGRLSFTDTGVAFAPSELLCIGDAALEAAKNRLADLVPDLEHEIVFDGHYLLTSQRGFDAEVVVRELRDAGVEVHPNHILFSHNGGSPCCNQCTCGGGPAANPYFANPYFANPYFANSVSANPYFANAVSANPYFANAVAANPYYANQMAAAPYFANPYFANPYFANPYFANYEESGVRPSSARPAAAPSATEITLSKNKARCFVLDTGLAINAPELLSRANHTAVPFADRDHPDETGDDLLDPASGHGTFIAGILEQLAPGQDVRVCRVLSTVGFGKVSDIAGRLDKLRTSNKLNDKTIINLSFGGYVDEDTPTLATAIAGVQQTGAVVVASAGNDGICRPSIPASLPGVIAVGSIEAHGRAPYSNHGPWVRACAPGTNLTSSFFEEYNGKIEPVPGPGGATIDPDDFASWASWTGTSFAAPVVAAALMRHMVLTKSTAQEAVTAVIDSPSLLRYPGLGTVVNLAPGM